MRILITNDDGIDAPGLKVLSESAAQFGDVIVVAPNQQRSSCGHQVTTHRALHFAEMSAGWIAVDGTPADCVRIGLLHVMPDADWVLAGVNDGGNLGVDVVMSGTVAAVREATLLGRKGAAFSQYRKAMRPPAWESARRLTERVFADLLQTDLCPNSFWNVNFPDPDSPQTVSRIVHCELDHHSLPMHFDTTDVPGELAYRSHYQTRPRARGSDVDVCFSGAVSISQLKVLGTL